MSREVVCLSAAGRERHKVGALMEKAGSHFVTNCELDLARRALSVGLSGQEGSYQVNKSEMYFRERPFMALKVSSKIVKSMQNLTQSQSREAGKGVMCSYFFVPVMSLAAAF